MQQLYLYKSVREYHQVIKKRGTACDIQIDMKKATLECHHGSGIHCMACTSVRPAVISAGGRGSDSAGDLLPT